jgi:hypothetical protein
MVERLFDGHATGYQQRDGSVVQFDLRNRTLEERRISSDGETEIGFTRVHLLESVAKKATTTLDAQNRHEVMFGTPETATPPRAAEFFVALLAGRHRDAILGDMNEQFLRSRTRFGISRARLIYWVDTARNVGPMLLEKAKKWGVIALLADAARRYLGT